MYSKQNIDFLKTNLFIIDSDNADEIGSRFVGFAYCDDKFIVNCQELSNFVKYGDYGYYIKILEDESCLTIEQDYYGLSSLFLYQNGSWFAVSNSLLSLINYLKSKGKKFTINKNSALALPFTWTSLEYKGTIFNEIIHVSCFDKLKIDKISKEIYIVRHDQLKDKDRIDIDSETGINLLDRWHAKWHALISALVQKHYDFRISISGGRDSRAALATVFSEGGTRASSDKLHFISDSHPSRSEDYAIAAKIGQKLAFDIDDHEPETAYYISSFTSLGISLFSKLWIHDQIHLWERYYCYAYFGLGGSGGEFLREHWDDDIVKCVNSHIPSVNLAPCIYSVFEKSIKDLGAEGMLEQGVATSLYRACRGRCHFGHYGQENFLDNVIAVAPLLDPLLDRLRPGKDRNLLFAVILDRFLPQLSDIGFDSNHKFASGTWKLAHLINKRFPYAHGTLAKLPEIKIQASTAPLACVNPPDGKKILQNMFTSSCLAKFVDHFYGSHIYGQILNGLEKGELFLDSRMVGLIGVYLAYLQTGSLPTDHCIPDEISALLKIA